MVRFLRRGRLAAGESVEEKVMKVQTMHMINLLLGMSPGVYPASARIVLSASGLLR